MDGARGWSLEGPSSGAATAHPESIPCGGGSPPAPACGVGLLEPCKALDPSPPEHVRGESVS